MSRTVWRTIPDRSVVCRALLYGVLSALVASGCGGGTKVASKSVSDPPTVQLVQPPVRTIVRVVGQPSFIQAYEHTAIYAKLASYVEKWIVDIGDKVKKGDVLATLFMPELVEELRTKTADVALAKDLIDKNLRLQDVANADVETAKAHLMEARAILGKYEASVARWNKQVARLTREVERSVVDPQILLESTDQLNENIAARDAAKAAIAAAQADLVSKQAAAAEAKVDVEVARARLVVAQSEQKRLEALVGYLTLTAPFDGVIVARNANTGDFLTPATGDPTARSLSPYQSPDRAAPVYVVDRTDVIRIFVDIPEQDADFVKIGTKGTVLVRSYRDREIPASVTRTSWAVNVTSRTLRAEIDVPNPNAEILPGMYAYGKVMIERPGVRALPHDALSYNGEQTYCWRYKNGRAVRTEIETGVSDGNWIEVTNHRVPDPDPAKTAEAPWTAFDGSEEIILGDLSILTDGGPVNVDAETKRAKVASAPATRQTTTRLGNLARSR